VCSGFRVFPCRGKPPIERRRFLKFDVQPFSGRMTSPGIRADLIGNFSGCGPGADPVTTLQYGNFDQMREIAFTAICRFLTRQHLWVGELTIKLLVFVVIAARRHRWASARGCDRYDIGR